MNIRLGAVIAFASVLVGITLAVKFKGDDATIETVNEQATSEVASPSPKMLGPLLTPVDRNLPNFSLLGLDGTQYTPETLKGKPWIINFWATWCPPCVYELPSMNAAYKIVEPQGIGMLAINVAEGANAIQPFLKRVPIDFPVVLGEVSTMAQWSARVLPTTIVVDANGKVVYEAQGEREWDDAALLQSVIDLL